MRELRQPRFEPLVRRVFQRLKDGVQRGIGFAQFRGELQLPRQSIRALEARAAVGAQVRDLLGHVPGGDALSQRLPRLRRERRVGERASQARQQPVAVHRRVPVVAAVERRRQLARRRDVGIAVEVVRDLVRILLVHAGEGEVRETLGGFRVEVGGVERQRCSDDKRDREAADHAADSMWCLRPRRRKVGALERRQGLRRHIEATAA